jgi:dTDP-4-dehydrorhamnose 3,5-epimerase-like enzyme
MNQKEESLIAGGQHIDERGRLFFFNDFDMKPVRRFYIIEHTDTNIVRAWQAHQKEQKWLYVVKGSFKIVVVKPDNWEKPSQKLLTKEIILKSDGNQLLHIPGGYANGFKALEVNSKLMVFSDFSIADAGKDDFRFDKDLWYDWHK